MVFSFNAMAIYLVLLMCYNYCKTKNVSFIPSEPSRARIPLVKIAHFSVGRKKAEKNQKKSLFSEKSVSFRF